MLPPPALAPIVEHLWLVRWEFPPGATFEAITLPHPVAHWTVEGDESVVRGVSQRPFARTLSGAGRVVAGSTPDLTGSVRAEVVRRMGALPDAAR